MAEGEGEKVYNEQVVSDDRETAEDVARNQESARSGKETVDAISELGSTMMDMGGSIVAGIAGGPVGIAVAAISAVTNGIIDVLKKIMEIIIQSSPYLSGVLKIVDKMFKLVLLPVGNMIAKILLPLAIKMANKTVAMVEKYANAGPEKLGEAASEGFEIIIDSMVEMIGTVLWNILPKIVGALGNAIGNSIAKVLGFGGGGGEEDWGKNPFVSATEDFRSLFGGATSGISSVIDQFGLTVVTSNKLVSNSAGELATVFYHGSASIEDGFQSVHDVMVIGSTGAISYLDKYNIANAGMLTIIDTTKTKFTELIDALDAFRESLMEDGEEEKEETGPPKHRGLNAWEWLETYLVGGIGGMVKYGVGGVSYGVAQKYAEIDRRKNEEYYIWKAGQGSNTRELATGGIVTKPTRALIGESGPEAVIPLGENMKNLTKLLDISVNKYAEKTKSSREENTTLQRDIYKNINEKSFVSNILKTYLDVNRTVTKNFGVNEFTNFNTRKTTNRAIGSSLIETTEKILKNSEFSSVTKNLAEKIFNTTKETKEENVFPEITRMATGGIITRPTAGLVGEAGPEAVIPLDKAKGAIRGEEAIHVHFHGDVYGMDDFERKIEKSVGRYSSRLRGAY